MKKITFIIVFVLCGLVGGLQAQKVANLWTKPVTDAAYSQSYGVADSEAELKFTLSGKTLTAKDIDNGAQVDIYSVLGAKVFTFTYNGNPVLLNLNKGIYIIRVGKYTQKIIL